MQVASVVETHDATVEEYTIFGKAKGSTIIFYR